MEWIKFKDQHPQEKMDVLVTDGETIGAGSIEYYNNKRDFHLHGAGFSGWEWEWDWGDSKNVTHWMPLPGLPD
jgi:hypothetical protein